MKRILSFSILGLSLSIAFTAATRCQDALSNPNQAITNSIGMNLIPIPAGRFTMGSPASERGSQEDEVLHKVDLTQDFHMGTTEVTEHQWAMVMEEPFRTEVVEIRDPDTKRLIKKEEKQIKNPKLDSTRPIDAITWKQAIEFCKRLGQLPEEKKEGRTYRLPTEAEWEYACRAGTSTAFSFGDDASLLNDYAWHEGNSSKRMPVASKKPNAWGLFDMHGNVFEWCHDCYGLYREDLVSNPDGHDTLISQRRVTRGGSFEVNASRCRSASRMLANGHAVGIRVVLGSEIPGTKLEFAINSIGQRLVKIPAGSFRMGSEKGGRPVHQVNISKSFFISTTEVTQAQWKAVMGSSPWETLRNAGGRYNVGGTFASEAAAFNETLRKAQGRYNVGDDYAATNISWNDAVEFCRRLSAHKDEQTAGRVYRLPTESEWEYACRAETTAEYSFGNEYNDLKDFAWFTKPDYSGSGVQLVGQKEPNYWGLYDIHGNVWEWCSDWYGDYPSDAVTDPRGSSSGTERVYRGGAWNEGGDYCRSSYRYADAPGFWSGNLGLRVVADAIQK